MPRFATHPATGALDSVGIKRFPRRHGGRGRSAVVLATVVKGSDTEARTAFAQAGQQLDEMTAEITAKPAEIDGRVRTRSPARAPAL